MQWRAYDVGRDREAVRRILREVGWLEPGKEEAQHDLVLALGRTLVAELNGEVECLVSTAPGLLRYLEEELPLVEVTTVATSRVARQRGLAKRLLARALAADAADGALVARVCVFDQGFYDQVGFGPGGYEHTLCFDPATLKVTVRPRVPRRLSAQDALLMHASRLARRRGHGAVNYPAPAITEAEVRWADDGFGLGYCDGPGGELTHHFWCEARRAERGPYRIEWMAYQTQEQFLELLGLIKSLGDQVALVEMREPAGIQLQDLLERPFRQHQVTARSRFENRMAAYAYWQVRMLDLPQCLAHTQLRSREVRFNLRITDPIARLLEEEAPWPGVGGEYIVTLGSSCQAKPGQDSALPTLTCSASAFTRLWLGVRPATGLAVTDELAGPAPLLEELDWALRLPEPKPDWDF